MVKIRPLFDVLIEMIQRENALRVCIARNGKSRMGLIQREYERSFIICLIRDNKASSIYVLSMHFCPVCSNSSFQDSAKYNQCSLFAVFISNPFLIVKPKHKVQYCSRCFARVFHFSHFYFYPIYPLLYCILLIFYVFMIISFFFLSLWFDFYNERRTGSNNRRLSTVSK